MKRARPVETSFSKTPRAERPNDNDINEYERYVGYVYSYI